MDKAYFRKKYKTLRADLSREELDNLSLEIANQCLKLPIWNATYYHIYLPIESKKEVNTNFLLHILQGRDKSVVISKTDFEAMRMTHILLQENTIIKLSEHGIAEPVDGIEIPPASLDIIFVPLLAFDQFGNRIGYGKGFYDGFLKECRPESLKIGLSFFEAEPKITPDITDFGLDYCITPKNIYSFKISGLYL